MEPPLENGVKGMIRLLGGMDLTLWALPFVLRWHFDEAAGSFIAVHFLCFELQLEWKQ